MSTHLLIAAAYLENLPQATKLVLMAVADSADEHTLEAAPGLPKLRAWSGLGKSQALAVVKALVEAGWVERVEAGGRGRRAVFRVFPRGIPHIPHPDEVRDRYEPGSGTPDPNDVSPASSPSVDKSGSIHIAGSGTPDPSDGVRVRSDDVRVRPPGPLQSSTSGNRPATAIPSAPTVETRQRSASTPSSSRPSFLGSSSRQPTRKTAPGTELPRRKADPVSSEAAIAETWAALGRRRRATALTQSATAPTTEENRTA